MNKAILIVFLGMISFLAFPGCSGIKMLMKTEAPEAPECTNDECVWIFDSYQPSQWEQEWRRGEETGERRDRECEVLATPEETLRSKRLIAAVTGLVLRGEPMPSESITLFSRMVYALRCGPDFKDTGRRRVQLIEPLIGILRDPLTICPPGEGAKDALYESFGPAEDAIQSKRFLLIRPAAPWTDTPDDSHSWRIGGFNPGPVEPKRCRAPMNFAFDLGASFYDNWHGDKSAASTLWLVDRFQRHNVSFDWIVSFELEKFDPDQIYANIPKDILPHYLYFNQGVESDPEGKWNPWRILMSMGVNPRDYVAVKLDIDAPEIEQALIEQLQNNPKIRLLVDEVFFEHHVNVKAMWQYWGTDKSPVTIKDSMRIFSDLRSKGVRMHSWP